MTSAGSSERATDRDRQIVAQRSRPDRTVFTEEGNTEGWIASDLVLAVDP